MAYTEEFKNSRGEIIQLSLRFHRESRMTYQISNLEKLFDNEYELLMKFLEHHKTIQVPRIQELYDYAQGNNHQILKGEQRRNETDMADSRAVHNFGKIISVFRRGYLVGNPVQVEYMDEETESETDAALEELDKRNNFYDLNRALVLDMSQVGRAYEIAFFNQDEELKVERLDPRQTFVIYNNKIDKRPIAGIRYYNPDPFNEDETLVEVYAKDRRYYLVWDEDGIRELEEEGESETSHINGFGGVQIIEHLNNDIGMGDYETELALIDLYDAAQSDTANYMTDLADAILVIFGNIDFPPEVDTVDKQMEYMRAMRKARLMQLIPPTDDDGNPISIDAKYLYKQYDVSGTEAYKDRLEKNIHEFTNTPDLNDEHFSGNQTGEAMKYKLFGLDQERVSTQALFEKGLRKRYQLLANIYPKVSDSNGGAFSDFDISKLKITFTPNLPQSDSEVVKMVKELWNITSDKTLFSLLELVTNVKPDEEIKRIAEEDGGGLPPEPRIPVTNTGGEADGEEAE